MSRIDHAATLSMTYRPLRAALNTIGITTNDPQPHPWILHPDLPRYIEGSATRELMREQRQLLPRTI